MNLKPEEKKKKKSPFSLCEGGMKKHTQPPESYN